MVIVYGVQLLPFFVRLQKDVGVNFFIVGTNVSIMESSGADFLCASRTVEEMLACRVIKVSEQAHHDIFKGTRLLVKIILP